MLILGVLVFGIMVFMASFLITRNADFDRGKVAALITLIAWGSMLFGLYMGKM